MFPKSVEEFGRQFGEGGVIPAFARKRDPESRKIRNLLDTRLLTALRRCFRGSDGGEYAGFFANFGSRT